MATTLKKFLGQERRTGTYVAAKYDAEHSKDLHDWAKNHLHLPQPVSPDQYHSTIIYSRQPFDAHAAIPNMSPGWRAKPIGYELFDEKKVLALVLECPELAWLHDQLRKAGGTHDFDQYIPHVTLCYDVSGASLELKELQVPTFSLRVSHLVVEPLDLNWNA